MSENKSNVTFMNKNPNHPILHEVKPTMTNKNQLGSLLLVMLVIGLGVITGYLAHRFLAGRSQISGQGETVKTIKSGRIVGSTDKSSFKDVTEGKLEKGGIDGEGTHKLIRPGGASQTVYLTSSVVNLDDYVGKKVRIWGETFAAEKAGWLMDVGRLELL